MDRKRIIEILLPPVIVFLVNSAVYWGAPRLTDTSEYHNLSLALDTKIPLIPVFILVYFGCYIFWVINYLLVSLREEEIKYRFFTADLYARIICFLFFVFYPTTNVRPELVGNGIFVQGMRFLYQIDKPVNLFPSGTFTIFGHSIFEFLGSTDWNPEDNAQGGGTVGALIFIVGSLCTCGLALLIATPFAVGSAIFMIEIAPKFGEKFYRPIVEIFAGIPSVVYGWVGLTVLIPAIKKVFHLQVGHSVLAAGIVLALMIFPTISNVAADSIHSVPKDYRMAAYGLGSTRWQSIYKVVIPAAGSGILSGIILGLARAFGEALAVAMVIGQTTALPKGLFSTTKSLTTEIAAQMGNATEGGEMKTALWTMALLLFLLSLLFILLIHYFSRPKKDKE